MGGAVSTGEDNDELVDNLVGADYIKTPMVEKVFRAVDRASYYLPDQRGNAYKDLAWKHGHLHLSAPCIYSEVMESLQLEPGNSFLNLGSGTGYLNTMVGLILGPYGINHGVEYHADVVEYAQKKLEEFKQICKSFDDFEFCEPWFVLGNCLQIPSSCRLYDRVYCGASCPPEHENYMKNLLAVGGILVMPLNDQLLQIRRTGETVWESKGVMSVSFATLISPTKEDANDSVELPEASIPILQGICRDSIRRIIRANIYKEHPSLNTVRKRPAKKQKARRQRRKRINMVPMSMGMMILGQFNGSDDSDDDSIIEHQGQQCHIEEDISDSGSDREGQEGSDEDRRPRGRNGLRRRSARQGIEEDIEEDEEEDEEEEEDYDSTHRRRVTARQTLHELATRLHEVRTQLSVQRQMDQMSRLPPNEEEEEENEGTNDEEKDDDEGVEEEDIYVSNDDEGHDEEENEEKEEEVRNKSGEQSSVEELDKEDMELDFTEMFPPPIPCSSGSPPHKQRYSSSTSVDTSETSGIGSLSEASAIGSLGEDTVLLQAMSSSSSQGSRAEGSPVETFMDSITEPTECIDTAPKECIKTYMKEKIDTLPLPEALKAFLMYYRD